MTEHRQVKDALYDHFARIGKAVANPKRIELLDLLCQSERSVEELALASNMGVKNTSAQLRELRLARLVETRRDGTRIYYRLADDAVAELYFVLRDVAAARLAEIEHITRDYFESRDRLEPVAREDLLRRAKEGDILLLDVRPREEYVAGHIPGAVSIPLDELEDRIEELPRDVDIVAYCRGPYCFLAPEAVSTLNAAGLRAARLEDGFPEWKRAGLKIATGPHA